MTDSQKKQAQRKARAELNSLAARCIGDEKTPFIFVTDEHGDTKAVFIDDSTGHQLKIASQYANSAGYLLESKRGQIDLTCFGYHCPEWSWERSNDGPPNSHSGND
jgi:hypothetical protein